MSGFQLLFEKHTAFHKHCIQQRKIHKCVCDRLAYIWIKLKPKETHWFINSELAYLQHTTLIKPVD